MRKPIGTYFTKENVREFHNLYSTLLASLHSLSLQMEAKTFPALDNREWTHRSTAVSSAVRTLIDGKTPPRLTGKNKPRGVANPDDLFALDEEES